MSLFTYSKLITSHSKFLFKKTTFDPKVCCNAGTILFNAGFKSNQTNDPKKRRPRTSSKDKC